MGHEAWIRTLSFFGGGFGGLFAARALDGAPVRVTLIDRHNYHL
jgi:NADH:ubiquinone reductase (H+-translocating)